jgi:hypothetical protein
MSKKNASVCAIRPEHVVENKSALFSSFEPFVSLCVTLGDSCRIVSGELELNHVTLQCGALVALDQSIL